MNKEEKTLEELQSSVASLLKEYKELIGGAPSADVDNYVVKEKDKNQENFDRMHSLIWQLHQNMADYIGNLHGRLNDHIDSSKHLPPISGPGQMAKAVKALGLSDDYDVKKRVIYAANGEYVIEAEMKKD